MRDRPPQLRPYFGVVIMLALIFLAGTMAPSLVEAHNAVGYIKITKPPPTKPAGRWMPQAQIWVDISAMAVGDTAELLVTAQYLAAGGANLAVESAAPQTIVITRTADMLPCGLPCDPCDCNTVVTATFPERDFLPGDEIQMSVFPTRGPDGTVDPCVTSTSIRCEGHAVGWDVTLDDVVMADDPEGLQLNLHGTIFDNSAVDHLLAPMEILVHDTEGFIHSAGTVIFDFDAPGGCADDLVCSPSDCGLLTVGGDVFPASCVDEPDFGCVCRANWNLTADPVPVAVPDVAFVELVPVPGTLPQLPGLDVDRWSPGGASAIVGDDIPRGGSGFDSVTPNPFNPRTEIRYRVGSAGPVRLVVFDARGQQVRTLVDEARGPGRFVIAWDGQDDAGRPVASGSYLLLLTTPDRTTREKMLLLR